MNAVLDAVDDVDDDDGAAGFRLSEGVNKVFHVVNIMSPFPYQRPLSLFIFIHLVLLRTCRDTISRLVELQYHSYIPSSDFWCNELLAL